MNVNRDRLENARHAILNIPMTVRSLAETLGMQPSTISRIRSGKTTPDTTTIAKISLLTDIPVIDFLELPHDEFKRKYSVVAGLLPERSLARDTRSRGLRLRCFAPSHRLEVAANGHSGSYIVIASSPEYSTTRVALLSVSKMENGVVPVYAMFRGDDDFIYEGFMSEVNGCLCFFLESEQQALISIITKQRLVSDVGDVVAGVMAAASPRGQPIAVDIRLVSLNQELGRDTSKCYANLGTFDTFKEALSHVGEIWSSVVPESKHVLWSQIGKKLLDARLSEQMSLPDRVESTVKRESSALTKVIEGRK